jgi:hypothetical protein
LKSTAFSVFSMIGLRPVSGTGLFVDFDFAEFDQAIDEIAQAVFVEIELRGGAGSGGLGHLGVLWFCRNDTKCRRFSQSAPARMAEM